MFSKTPTYFKQTTFHFFTLLFVLQLVSYVPTAAAQAPSFCGSFGPFQAPTNNPDSIVFDRFGNTYLRSDLMGNSLSSASFRNCTAGYFELRVDDTIPAAEEAVICQVFSDVSDLIQRRQLTDNCGDPVPQPLIRIQVMQQVDPMGIEDGRLGTATPMYTPIPEDCPDGSSAVLYSNIMRKLNGEIVPRTTDGFLAIDIDPPSPYYYGTNPGGITSNQYDLYSIVLHEVMHLVGYSGVTGFDGQPNTAFSFSYSAWDRILHTTTAYDPGGNSQNVNPMLMSDCVNNCYQLDTSTFASVQDFQEAVTDNCTNNGIDIIVGNMGLAPISGGGSGNFPNQISHLNPTCGNPNYVMQSSIDVGVVRRNLTGAEIDILCALGYQTATCDGCFIAVGGNNVRNNFEYGNCCDLFYSTCVDQVLMIPISELLCNDFTNGPDLELTSVYPRNTSSTYTVRIVGDSIEFISSAQAYYSDIGYTVEGCDCQLLSGTFAVNVGPCEIECEETDPCQDILCLNGFEDYEITGQGGGTVEFYPGEPFWIDNPGNNSPDVFNCPATNNIYIHCGNFGTIGGTEGFAVPVDPPIAPGCSLTLSLDLSQRIDELTPASMVIKGSDEYPCTLVGSTIGAGCDDADCGANNQSYVCLGIIETTASSNVGDCPVNWDTHELLWTNDQNYPINVLIFHPLSREQGGSRNNILVDNITASLDCAENITTTHNTVPQIACSGEQMDIQLTVCAANGAGQINLDYNFPLPTGVMLVNGNLSGMLTLNGGGCEQLNFTVALDAALPVGMLPFELDYTSLGACASYSFEVPLSRLPESNFTYTRDCGTIDFSPTNTDTTSNHLWDFGDGQSSTEIQPIYVYTNRGGYTVTHTVSNSCGSISSTQTITIIDPAPPEANFMISIQDCSTLVNFFSMTMDSVDHIWDFDGDINTAESTVPNPVFDFQAPGTYTITHITINSCSISSSTQTIVIEECTTTPCDCPNIIEGGNGLALSSTSLPPNNLDNTGNCLTISGTLVIDLPYRITGGEIQMQPGSKVIVSNLQQLELIGVDVHGCDQMWQGIEVRSFGNLTMRQSMIQDAHWGIHAHHWANLDIGRSVFNNNYIGIHTAPTSNASGQFVNARIAVTNFSGTEELLPRYPNQQVTLSDSSRSGVELYNTHSFVIGGSRDRALANSFSGLHYGVYTQNCFNISVQRAQMNGLIGESTGVYMDNSVAIMVDDSEMSDLDYGLRGFRSSPILLESNIDSHREGVLMQTGIGRSVLIDQSNIVSPRTCIYLSDYSGGNERVEITECSLFKKEGLDAGAAIFVNNCTARLIIAENPSIAFSPSGFGIRIANSIGAITIENNPLIYSTGDYWANVGINLANVSGAQVYNNSVNNSGIFAISAFDSPSNLFCCNQVNKARDGVFFGGGCADTRLKNTDFGQHQYGLNLFNTVISPQAFHGNNWIGADCEMLDAVFVNNSNGPFDVIGSRFITNLDYIPRGYDFIGVFGGGTPQEWFVFEIDVDPHCTFYCNEPPHLLPPPHSPCTHLAFNEAITDINHWAATDLGITNDTNKGIHNREQHHLLQKLDCLPSLLGQDHSIDQFYQAAQNNSLGQFHQQRQTIQNLFIPIETEELDQLYNERIILSQQINQLDSIYWSEQIDSLIIGISEVLIAIDQLETAHWQQNLQAAQDLTIINQSLPESNIFEANEKATNEIVLETVARGIYEFDTEQMELINMIAAQCPLSGGLAVHQARGLQALYQPQFYDDQENCQTLEERQHYFASGINEKDLIKVYPNPASHVLHIQIEEQETKPLFIEFWTVDGRKHKQFKIKSSLDINIQTWPLGIYLYRIKDKNENILLQDRLLMIKE